MEEKEGEITFRYFRTKERARAFRVGRVPDTRRRNVHDVRRRMKTEIMAMNKSVPTKAEGAEGSRF